MSRLFDKYKADVIPAMMKKFNYKNVMQVPKLDKIVLNMACGDAVGNAKVLESAIADLTAIAGQKPVVTRAKIKNPRQGGFSLYEDIKKC